MRPLLCHVQGLSSAHHDLPDQQPNGGKGETKGGVNGIDVHRQDLEKVNGGGPFPGPAMPRETLRQNFFLAPIPVRLSSIGNCSLPIWEEIGSCG